MRNQVRWSNFGKNCFPIISTNVQGRNTLEAEVSSLKFKQGEKIYYCPGNGLRSSVAGKDNRRCGDDGAAGCRNRSRGNASGRSAPW